MLDKRHYKRFTVEGMDVHAKTRFATEVDILDLSLGGACFKSKRRLIIGGNYTIKFDWKDNPLTLKGLLVWEKIGGIKKLNNGDTVPIYVSGIQFDNILSEKAESLMDYIDSFLSAKKSRMKGLGLSIRIGDETVLSYTDGDRVKVLNKHGILVEAERALDIDTMAELWLSLPDEDEPIGLTGRVLSCIELPNTEPTLYDIGIELLDMSEEHKEKIHGFTNHMEQSEEPPPAE